jgi:hypothetical protein
VFSRTEYRVFKDGIPCFQGRNTVFSRTEYRVFKDGISFTSKLGQRILT